MSQLQAAGAFPLGCAQVADGWEVDLRGRTALQQMEESRDRGGGESQQSQRMEKSHVNNRSANPNGMSVSTWW